MSLQVWLPLNKNVIENKGLSDVVFTNNGATFVDSGIESCWNSGPIHLTNLGDLSFCNMSISFWAKTSNTTGGWQKFVEFDNTQLTHLHGIYFRPYNNSPGIQLEYNPSVYWLFDLSKYNEWHHYVFTVTNGKSCGYMDGVLKYTSNESVVDDKIGRILLNSGFNSTPGESQVSLSDFRIYDHALSDKEVYELAKGLMFHLKLDNTDLYDCSGYGWSVSKYSSGTLSENSDTARYGKSLTFDNAGISVYNISKSFSGGDSKFTISTWINQKENVNSNDYLFGNDYIEGDANGWQMRSYNMQLRFWWTTNQSVTAFSFDLNKWVNIVITYDGSHVRFYKDGVLILTKDWVLDAKNPTIDEMRIGMNDSSHRFSGSISDFRIYRTALTDEQVAELYKVGGSIDNHGNVHCYELREDKPYDGRLRFESVGNSTIGLSKLSTNQSIEYSFDYNTWTSMTTATTISLTDKQVVYMRGILSADNTTSNYTQFIMNGVIKGFGNLAYLWDYSDLNAALKQYCGCSLFNNCVSLTTAPELPAMEMAEHCYEGMFRGCTGLSIAPELPASTLANQCYRNMFRGCSSLIYPSVLPAINLNNATRCYYGMYAQCTSLTTAPELPATTLSAECYNYMFGDCTSLTTAPELPASTLANYCYYDMFGGCTSLTTAPILKADVLVTGCYNNMFAGCTNLNYIKCLATNISASACLTNWTNGVSSTGTFVKNSAMTSWPTGVNGIPSGWTVQDVQ